MVKRGHQNTRFFRNIANGRRCKNPILAIEVGNLVVPDFGQSKMEVIRDFKMISTEAFLVNWESAKLS